MAISILFYTSFGFYIALIIIEMTASLYLFRIYQNSEDNKLALGTSLLFVFYALARIIMVVFDYPLTRFDQNSYQTFAIVWKFGYIINCIGFLSLIFISEIAILKKKSRFSITIFYSIFIIISILPDDIETVQMIAIIPSALAMIFVPATYLYLARHALIRKRALAVFFGYIIFFAGAALLTEDLVQFFISYNPSNPLDVRSLIHIISIGLKIFGILFILYGYRQKLV